MNLELEGAQVLERAAEVLEDGGWCQGSYVNPVGQHCALGAVSKAFREVAQHLGRYPKIVSFLATAIRPDYVGAILDLRQIQDQLHDVVVSWNDSPDRTADEVVETIRLVAKDLRNQAVPE